MASLRSHKFPVLGMASLSIQLPVTTFELRWKLATFECLFRIAHVNLFKVTLQHALEIWDYSNVDEFVSNCAKTDNSGFLRAPASF